MKSKTNPFVRIAMAPAILLVALSQAHAQGPYTLYFDLNGTAPGSGVTNNSTIVWWSALSDAKQWAVNDGSGTVETRSVNDDFDGSNDRLSFNNPNTTPAFAKSVVFSGSVP